MSLFSRFFGKKESDDTGAGFQLAANPAITKPLSLQVLFSGECPKDPQQMTSALRAYHRSMAKGRCELDPGVSKNGNLFGLVGWGNHVIKLVGFDAPMPSEAVESCVQPSHYPQELKARARAHQSHVLLYYAGRETSPYEQYAALACVAGVLARFGAIVVLNESAHTSFPAHALADADPGEDILELVRTLPLLILYCGFVKHEVEGVQGVWMRTYGAPLLDLPDFAALAVDHSEGERYFGIFENILNYLRESKAQLAAGHTMQIGEQEYLRFRAPSAQEPFLSGETEPLVAEIIGADEINR